MSLITLIAPHTELLTAAQKLLAADHPDIDIAQGLLSEGVRIATEHCANGTEIIITRGGTAAAIRKTGLDVVVVEIAITGFDIIRTVEHAKRHGKRIGAVAFPQMMREIESLAPVLGVSIRLYPVSEENDAEMLVARAIADGMDVILGGYISRSSAQKHSIPFALIESGADGILNAVLEAKRIAQARNIEKTKAGQFKAILHHSSDGIITVDAEGRITLINRVAERMTGIKGQRAIGKPLPALWPDLKIERILRSNQEEVGQILNVRHTDILCNKAPVMVDGICAGAIATFHDVVRIQKMEADVRQHIHAKGHVAAATFNDIITVSPAMAQTKALGMSFAETEASILITGETGTGKELFAQSCHNHSGRNGPFVAINCAALPAQILESELFGYVPGAFTGASQKGKTGLFETAHGGTIFLDEIGEIDMAMQGKLLRVLQEKKVMRLGSDRIVPIDVRIIAATNKNLKSLMEQNLFRSDLFYRLNVLHLRIPPLRNRLEDIAHLAQWFLDQNRREGGNALKLSHPAIMRMNAYPWPGNVRELQNVIERLAVTCREQRVTAEMTATILSDHQDDAPDTTAHFDEISEIRRALATSRGKYTEAANLLGMSRSTLWRRLKHYNLK